MLQLTSAPFSSISCFLHVSVKFVRVLPCKLESESTEGEAIIMAFSQPYVAGHMLANF